MMKAKARAGALNARERAKWKAEAIDQRGVDGGESA